MITPSPVMSRQVTAFASYHTVLSAKVAGTRRPYQDWVGPGGLPWASPARSRGAPKAGRGIVETLPSPGVSQAQEDERLASVSRAGSAHAGSSGEGEPASADVAIAGGDPQAIVAIDLVAVQAALHLHQGVGSFQKAAVVPAAGEAAQRGGTGECARA